MRINGYSERGIVNSMAYFFSASGPQIVDDFIKILGISLEETKYDYTILIEQSFSDFGDSDLIFILKNENNKKIVIFIECKIKTYQGTFNIKSEFNKIINAIKESKKITGISSNLFVQLYYKYLLIKTNGDSSKDSTVNKIFKKSNDNRRFLGSNKIVLKAYDKIKDADDYYYIAITPTAPNEMDSKMFKNKIDELKLMPSKNVCLCYWGDIENYFLRIGASKVLDVFKYNEGQIY
jgi:hypothetical protein